MNVSKIFGKCEQLVPKVFSLINYFFKKRWHPGERAMCQDPFSESWVLRRGKPWSPIPELHIKNTSTFSAVCLRICFISYLTEASCWLRTCCTQLWGKMRGEGENWREHPLFSQYLKKCGDWRSSLERTESRGAWGGIAHSLTCLKLWPSLSFSSSREGLADISPKAGLGIWDVKPYDFGMVRGGRGDRSQ